MSTAPQQSVSTEKTKKIASALLRYRILAYTTGVWLLVLVVEIVAKYGFGNDSFGWVGIVHGWVYAVYLVFTLDLAIKVRWPAARTIGTLLAGTVPFLSFFVEHWRTTQVKRDFGV
ncbi:DUF3817 domain-containing protein [Rhodococcus sp. PAMC28707]|uniref:DUF3817 domain-containing protein n=1 Tax=unclassified Rhodococcus (in: high G+C Gram-positive bacteria) TaxID=192944 RepID=UPI00109E2BE2|nr:MULTISPECIES: DUF3817 domain-containing protein [unclassified Rhodococcus (in: high G+C Gram-positive bacteria)]QCB51837.1 DUF3817 domain-containing protein [Rhodococcus sp. PAMC28705]QCB59994.1 DUF3817 domain-containing protein [Rhodococcus sp. PAMC28707]